MSKNLKVILFGALALLILSAPLNVVLAGDSYSPVVNKQPDGTYTAGAKNNTVMGYVAADGTYETRKEAKKAAKALVKELESVIYNPACDDPTFDC